MWFFSYLLQEVITKNNLLEIDRAHHTLAPRLGPGRHQYQTNELALREVCSKRKLYYQGQQIRLVEENWAEVMRQWVHYKEVMAELMFVWRFLGPGEPRNWSTLLMKHRSLLMITPLIKHEDDTLLQRLLWYTLTGGWWQRYCWWYTLSLS